MADDAKKESSPALAENVFLTEQKKSRGEKQVSTDIIEDALLEVEELDKKIQSIELECEKSNLQMGVSEINGVSSSDGDPSEPSLESNEFGHRNFLELGLEESPVVNENSRLDTVDLSGVPDAPGKDSLLLEFPVTIDIKDIVPTGSDASCISSINAGGAVSLHGSVQSSIERNKNLCSVATAGRNSLLTSEEEERISEMLELEEEENEKYGKMPSIEEEREAELDSLLLGLGFNIDDDDGPNNGIEGLKEGEQQGLKISSEPKGDPVLRELALQREREQHETNIDRALRALLREPLPPVIRITEGTEGEDADVSLLSSLCAESTLTAPMTEEDMQQLIQQVKKQLEDGDLELADHNSVRALAQSIFDEESSKTSVH
ncbi:hypothetical protein ACHAXR_010549 [Thalassiosira sp. AJA248-18]